MLALGLLLNTVGLGLCCWLIFMLAIYALPFFVAINAGILAFHRGAGVLGTPIVAVGAGGATLAIAQIAFALIRSMILRAVICGRGCLAGYTCWLSCRSRDGADRSAFARLAGGLRLPRHGFYRRPTSTAQRRWQ